MSFWMGLFIGWLFVVVTVGMFFVSAIIVGMRHDESVKRIKDSITQKEREQ